MKTLLCIPTYNAGAAATELVTSLKQQSYMPDSILIIDSSSQDKSIDIFRSMGARVHSIPRSEFNHGTTRQLSLQLVPDAEIIIFLTQDSVLADRDSLKWLVGCFDDPTIGAAYGRQLPRTGARAIESHARLFNYPPQNIEKTLSDAPRLGIKTVFFSNSFSAYRRKALTTVGGFPTHTILCEDVYVAAKMLFSGGKIIYCADSKVYHSHRMRMRDEFKRYFDLGVFYSREKWILDQFGHAEGEGLKYVRSELEYLRKKDLALIPSALLRTLLKFLGYKLGAHEKYLPLRLKYMLSYHKQFWVTDKHIS